jgi:hypothetical protein
MNLRPAIADIVGIVVEGADSPEQAAEIALGQTLMRSGVRKGRPNSIGKIRANR